MCLAFPQLATAGAPEAKWLEEALLTLCKKLQTVEGNYTSNLYEDLQ
jgi:hypothetical protein